MNPFNLLKKQQKKKTRTIIRFHRPVVYKDILSLPALINKDSFGYYVFSIFVP